MITSDFNTPIVWTIAGSDSSGGAGIQADLQTFRSFNVYGCSIITAITSQNSVEIKKIDYTHPSMVANQIEVLSRDLFPVCIKLGMMGNNKILSEIIAFLKKYSGYIVYDPVFFSSTGRNLQPLLSIHSLLRELFPCVDLLTPNRMEAEFLSGINITSFTDIEKAASLLLSFGVKSVLIKGGHFGERFCQDYYCNGSDAFWITNYRIDNINTHGSGCTLSSAIAANYALGFDEKNAVVLAKHYLTQSIRLAKSYGKGPGPVFHETLEYESNDFPWVSQSAEEGHRHFSFPSIDYSIGLYPIVNQLHWIKTLFLNNINVIQLRIKKNPEFAFMIRQAIHFAQEKHLKLFINDYWELAIQYQAYGVHLGQDDLRSADMKAIQDSNVLLGISTHDYFELATALNYQPSYIAFGPIFSTTSKQMAFSPQGMMKLKIWRKLVTTRLVAIGGINLSNIDEVLKCHVDGVAFISAIHSFLNKIYF